MHVTARILMSVQTAPRVPTASRWSFTFLNSSFAFWNSSRSSACTRSASRSSACTRFRFLICVQHDRARVSAIMSLGVHGDARDNTNWPQHCAHSACSRPGVSGRAVHICRKTCLQTRKSPRFSRFAQPLYRGVMSARCP